MENYNNQNSLNSSNYNNQNLAKNNDWTIPLQNLAENRIQALKSLASMLLKELELLENLAPKNMELSKKLKICLADEVEHFETELIRTALIISKGHQRNASYLLGLKITTLNNKLKRFGIDPRDYSYLNHGKERF